MAWGWDCGRGCGCRRLGAAGQWQGGLAGAALIAAGGFVAPELSDWLKDRRSRSVVLDQVSSPVLLQQAAPPRGGDAFWLRPEQGVVEFIDRPELAVLREWCTAPDGPGLMLVTGAGGVGKTRLALRLAEKLGGQGWLCRVVSAGGESGVAEAARAAHRGGVLLLVDYAETRPGVADLLRDVAGEADSRLRVLLVARGEGEWWARLKGSSDDRVRSLVAEAGLVRVGALASGLDGAELVRAAVPEFARAVGAAVPTLWRSASRMRPCRCWCCTRRRCWPLLDARDHPGAGPARAVADEGVLARLLSRETAFWLASAAVAGVSGAGGIDSVTAGQVVAVACLFAAADESDAGRLLRRVPGLADAPEGTVLKIARWLRHAYPAGRSGPQAVSARWWGSLQPDLLAERHVVTEFADSPAFAAACLRDLTAVQAAGALTVLARACAHRPQAPALIASALRADLPGLGVPAVDVAVQTSGPVGAILADVAGSCDATLETLVKVEEVIPYPTIALARADMLLTARINSMLPADASKADLARWRDLLGVMFSQLGRPADALPATQEAVTIRRELAAANPDRYRPDLARSLSNLGIWFSELGRPADALPATQEAVTIRRELAAANPDRYRPDLARSLSNLGIWFSELGRPADALPATQEAVTAYRELAAANPDRYRPDLARSLDNLGVWFSELGRPADALPATQEAVTAYRELAAANPDRYRPDLAASLDNLGVRFSELGRPADALPVTQEAVTIRRELAAANPDRYRPDLARSLDNLGVRFSELGRPADALPVTEEAVTDYRELAAANPDRYRPDLARLTVQPRHPVLGAGPPGRRPARHRGSRHHPPRTGRRQPRPLPPRPRPLTDQPRRPVLGAGPPGRRAARHRGSRHHPPGTGRRQPRPLPPRPRHRRSATSASGSRSWAARPTPCRSPRKPSAIRRELAAANPDRYRPDLAQSLDNLGIRFSELGRPADALPVTEEAVAIRRELAAANPDRYRPDLARSLYNLGIRFSELGRPADALPLTEEAVAIHRELAAANPDRYRPDLARSLDNLGSGSRSWAARPTRCRSPRKPSPSAGNWPPPTPTATAPTWPAH